MGGGEIRCPGTVITERVREKFKRFSETGRVFFMGAACGFGKSTVAEELLSGKRVKRISFPEGDISSVTTGGWDFFLAAFTRSRIGACRTRWSPS